MYVCMYVCMLYVFMYCMQSNCIYTVCMYVCVCLYCMCLYYRWPAPWPARWPPRWHCRRRRPPIEASAETKAARTIGRCAAALLVAAAARCPGTLTAGGPMYVCMYVYVRIKLHVCMYVCMFIKCKILYVL
jgi:hypothetical protein